MPNPKHAVTAAEPLLPVRRAYIPPDLTYETMSEMGRELFDLSRKLSFPAKGCIAKKRWSESWRGDVAGTILKTMRKLLTFVDSSVLINAAVGPVAVRRMRALAIIGDAQREFVATQFVKLEVLPIPSKYQKQKELRFDNRFFNNIATWVDAATIIQPALTLACQYGLGGMDALHLAAAIAANAEFVSAEKPTKPFYQAYSRTFSIC